MIHDVVVTCDGIVLGRHCQESIKVKLPVGSDDSIEDIEDELRADAWAAIGGKHYCCECKQEHILPRPPATW